MKFVSFALLLSSVVASDKTTRSSKQSSSSSSSSSASSSSDEEILRKVKLSLLSLSGATNPSGLGLCQDDPYFETTSGEVCGDPNLCDTSSTAVEACCVCGGGYVFFPYANSSGNEIVKVETVPEAFDACSSDPECKGFNSNGWMVHTIKPKSNWSTWTSDPFLGMYVKQKALIELEKTDAVGVCGYRFIPFLDCGYNDIKNFNEGSVSDFGKACDELDACVAFNTAGYLKKKMQPQKWYHHLTEDPDVGFYVKTGLVSEDDCPAGPPFYNPASYEPLYCAIMTSDKSSRSLREASSTSTMILEDASTHQDPLTLREMLEPYDGKFSDGTKISVSGGGFDKVYGEWTSRSIEDGETFKIVGGSIETGVALCIESCDLDVFTGTRFNYKCVTFYGDNYDMLVSDENGNESTVPIDRPLSNIAGITYDKENNCVTHVNSYSKTCTPLPDHFEGKMLRVIGLVWNSNTAVIADDKDMKNVSSVMDA